MATWKTTRYRGGYLTQKNGEWNILPRWSPEISHYRGVYLTKRRGGGGGETHPRDGRFKIIDSQGYYASRKCSRAIPLYSSPYGEVTHTLLDYSFQPFTKAVLKSSLGGFHWRGRVPWDHSTRPTWVLPREGLQNFIPRPIRPSVLVVTIYFLNHPSLTILRPLLASNFLL